MSLYGNSDSNSTGNGTMPLGIGQCAPGENTGDSNLWIVGVVITLIGTITSNGGTNVQKISVMREAAKPKIYQRPYVLQPLWCVGAAAWVVLLRARRNATSSPLTSPTPPSPIPGCSGWGASSSVRSPILAASRSPRRPC